jgi:hypothetical protein
MQYEFEACTDIMGTPSIIKEQSEVGKIAKKTVLPNFHQVRATVFLSFVFFWQFGQFFFNSIKSPCRYTLFKQVARMKKDFNKFLLS